jgi:PAS domain S-box-containing protein
MQFENDENDLLRSVALQNAKAILLARQRAEQALVQAKEELRESNERISSILASITDGFIVVDRDWCFSYVNQRAEEILRPLHKSQQHLLGRNLWHEFPDLVGTAVEQNYRRAMEQQVTAEFEFFYPTLDSWFEIRAYPANTGISIYFQDITKRKGAEEALRESEERLRATFDQAAVGIAIADLDGRFLEMNRKFTDVLRYPPEELRGLSWRDITHPSDVAASEAQVRRLLTGEITDFSLEKRYVRKDASEIWGLTTVTLLKDAAGQPRRFIGAIDDISHSKRTEEALRQSEQFNRAIIESSRDCTKALSLDGRLLWINEAGLKALCLDRAEDVLGKSWIEFWDGEDRAAADAAVRAAAGGGSGGFVGCFPVAGQPRWWDVVVTPILDAAGKPEKLLTVSRDVTERKQGEQQLRRSEEELRALANSIPQLTWMAQPDGHIFWYNQGWYDYTGTSFEQMQGWGWQSVHDPEILPQVLQQWRESISSGNRFEMEFPLRGADGVFRWFLTRVNPVRDSDGRVVRWFGTNTDVDRVKRIEAALQDEGRILELLNQTGAKLASELDLQTLLQTVTDAATQLSGAKFGAFFYNTTDANGDAYLLYTLSGAPREAFEKFGHPRATPLFGPTFNGSGPIRCADVLTDPRYGKLTPHRGMPAGHLPVRSYLAVPVISRSGEVMGGLFFGHPEPGVFTERAERIVMGVSSQAAVAIDNARLYEAAQKAAAERKQLLESEQLARAQAERMSELKDEFLANLSHELRTPLNAIFGWSQVLRRRLQDNAELHQGLEIIERNARMQTRLIEDLLDMSRITAGKMRLDVQPVEPVSFIEAALETLRPAADAKGIRLEPLLDPTAGPVSGDPARLQQVVWNLLSNAIKFTGKGGKVQVLLERVNSHIEITVADTGIGIPSDFLPYVFERFRQADASLTRVHGGLGLGLSIVKHLVELHGGTVRASSPGDGGGATFSVHLPLTVVYRGSNTETRRHPRAPDVTMPVNFKAPDLAGIKVLVVEDEADARELIQRVLTECGATVITVSKADEALRRVEQERPHLLLSDIGMPGVDGYELLRRVRALGPARGGKVPAIALTAFARSEDRTRALRAGFQVHLSKPVEPSELMTAVASVASQADESQSR